MPQAGKRWRPIVKQLGIAPVALPQRVEGASPPGPGVSRGSGFEHASPGNLPGRNNRAEWMGVELAPRAGSLIDQALIPR